MSEIYSDSEVQSTIYDSDLTLNSSFIEKSFDHLKHTRKNSIDSTISLDVSFHRYPPSNDEVSELHAELDEIMPPDDRVDIFKEFENQQIISDKIPVLKLERFIKATNRNYYPKSTKRNILKRLKKGQQQGIIF